MGKKMLIERVDNLEGCVQSMLGAIGEMRLLLADTMKLLDIKLPQYDILLKNRKKVLSKAKAMRLAKRKKRQEMSGKKGAKKDAR